MVNIISISGSQFMLVDADGSTINQQKLGLLLFKGGTVCDDSFDKTSADAICRQINSTNTALTWISGNRFADIQKNLEIKLDDVRCDSAEWEKCSFAEEDNCNHIEDIFLVCVAGLFS